MIKEHRRSFKLLRLGLDLFLVSVAYYGIYGSVRLNLDPFGLQIAYHPDYHIRVPLFLALCWCLTFLASGAYEKNTRAISPWAAAGGTLKLLAVMLAVFSVGVLAFKVQFLSRKFLGVYFGWCWLLLSLSKYLEFRALAGLRKTGFNTRSILLIGEGAELAGAHAVYLKHPEWGYRILGALGLSSRPARNKSGLRVLGRLADLEETLRTRIVDEIVFAAPSGNSRHLQDAMDSAELAGVPLRVFLGSAFEGRRATLEDFGGRGTLITNPDPRNYYLRLIKGLQDRLGALFFLIVLSPLMLLISMAILLSMGRPVFFSQKRAGLKGRVFFLHKFRTMIPDARKAQGQLDEANEMSGPVFKIKNDPRITALGRFLRKTSLDELPQFWDVLLGRMSLVGPRPLANYEARKVPHWARRRYSVKPGITCYWQVMGRNRLTFDEWMRLDIRYIEEWSLWTDIKILLKTLPAVLFSRGAY